MGREWYFNWGSSKSSSKRGGTMKGGCGSGGEKRSATPPVATAAAAVATSGGCMNAVLHMFDFQHLHLCLHPIADEPFSLKGVEAPRNSLESITEDNDKDNSLNIPVDIKIKTNRRDKGLKLVQAPRGKVEDTLSQSSCSPTSARTPTLVARLMGLDILPESNNTTPRSSSSYTRMSSQSLHITSSTTPPPSRATRTRPKSTHNNEVSGQRSMPETLNSTSSSQKRRSTTDVVDPHRFSLQINKEKSIVKEMESSRPSCSAINTKRREGRKYEDENKSPGYYAKQIMKQVRETVSRRSVGADITNTVSQRELIRRDEHLLNTTPPTTKPKKVVRKEGSLSKSPKLTKISENVLKPDIQEMVLTIDKRLENGKQQRHGQDCCKKKDMDMKKLSGAKPSSKMCSKSYDSVRNKKDEQFVRNPARGNNNSSADKKCKKTPLSSDLVHASVPSIIPLKKDSSSLQIPLKFAEKQESSSKAQVSKLVNSNPTTTNTNTRLSCGPIQQTNRIMQEESRHKPAEPEKKDSSTSTNTSASSSTYIAEFQYISRILKCTGIDRDTPISFTRWFSPSNPLNPSIFNALEASHYPPTAKSDHSSPDINQSLLNNRKLIFHLVDEILADILKPYNKLKPYYYSHKNHNQKQQQINGFQLVKTVCTQLRSFPSKDCQTLQDIDALVEKDMPRLGESSNLVAVEEEGEAIVAEIEGDIIDSLVQEMAGFFSMQRYDNLVMPM